MNWSLAVPNEIVLADGTVDVLIAVSCFDDDMKIENHFTSARKVNNVSSTWIISLHRKRKEFPLQ